MPNLALFGGAKAVPEDLHTFKHPLALQSFDLTSLSKVDVLSYNGSGLTDEFEQEFASLTNRKYGVAFNSGTSSISAMFDAIDIKAGDEVIVPDYTFFAAAMPLIRLGAIPVLADCGYDGNVNVQTIEPLITYKTKALLVVHLWGNPCDMNLLTQLCEKHSIHLIEDASHSHGARFQGQVIGSFGAASAFSLGAYKIMSGGQGGIMVCNDRELYEKAILNGHYNRRGARDVSIEELKPYAITGTGYNTRMHPYAAALLMPQLQSLDLMIKERNECAAILMDALSEFPYVEVPPVVENGYSSRYAFAFRYAPPSDEFPTRNEVVTALNAEGAVGIDYPGSTCPISRYEIFKEQARIPYSSVDSEAEKYHSEVIKTPTWYGPDRLKFANAYAEALQKVFSSIEALQRVTQ